MVARLAFAPRAFLQIFITTTLHHRLASLCSDRFASVWSRLTVVLCSVQITLIHAGFQSILAVLARRYCSTSYAIDSVNPSNDLTEARAVPNQAKNNVTSRVRLDEKYAERRALFNVANRTP
jgi:hypothetical protein